MIQYRLHLVRTIAINIGEKKIMPGNALFQGFFTQVSFDTSKGNQIAAVIFSKWLFFQITLDFSQIDFLYTFMTFLTAQYLQ